MSVFLSANELHKTYRTASGDVPALTGFSYNFEKGLFYAILGRSGSGKSTLLHILGGLMRPTSGSVYLNGTSFHSLNDEKMAVFRRRHMGFVFQQFNLLDEYTVEKNICMPLLLDGKKPDSAFLQYIIKKLGLQGKLRKFPAELSGGEQQRVAIARSLIARPDLIIADEPTGNLDKKTSEETLSLLRSCVTEFGQTLILVTHNEEVSSKADRCIYIEDGRLV